MMWGNAARGSPVVLEVAFLARGGCLPRYGCVPLVGGGVASHG